MEDALAHGRGGGEEDWRVRKAGSRFWAVGELSPIREGGKVIGFVRILRDRTVQRETEEMIPEERHALEVLNRAGSALALETDLQRLVQIVTEAGVELAAPNLARSSTISPMVPARATCSTRSRELRWRRSRNSRCAKHRSVRADLQRRGYRALRRHHQGPRYGKNPPRRGMPEGHLPVRSYLAVPVISRTGGVIGGLFFGHGKPGVFSEHSERGLRALPPKRRLPSTMSIFRRRRSARSQNASAPRRRSSS
jgi:hypothetical protein